MSTLGIIGGVGPEATIIYYRTIVDSYRRKKGDGSYPSIIINSINLKNMVDWVTANELDKVAGYLTEEIQKLARAGADFALIAAGTPHIVFDEVQRQSPIPLISIIESTCKAAEDLGLKKVGLLGTTFTMKGTFYSQVFERRGISIVTPDEETQQKVHGIYMNELVNGLVLDESKQELLLAVNSLKKVHDIQGLILGGTELSLILNDGDDAEIPFLDTTRIHAESAVDALLQIAT